MDAGNSTSVPPHHVTDTAPGGASPGDYFIFHVGSAINMYGPPVIVAVGTFGNLLALAVMWRAARGGRVGSGALYVIVLAVLDTVLLWLGLLQYWFLFSFTPWLVSEPHCHGMFFLVNVFSNLAGWVVVAMTAERFAAVTAPLAFSSWSSVGKSGALISGLAVFAVVKNFHYIWTADFVYDPETKSAMCAFGLVNKALWARVWQWVDTCLASLLPFACLIVLNGVIIVQLRRLSSRRGRLTGKAAGAGDAQLTAMLLAVSVMFVVLTAPLFCLRTYFTFIKAKTPWQQAVYHLGHHVCHKLWYCNNAANFYLYCVAGRTFRRDLKRLLTCTHPRAPAAEGPPGGSEGKGRDVLQHSSVSRVTEM